MAPEQPFEPEIEFIERPIVYIDGPEETALDLPHSTDEQDQIEYLSGLENLVIVDGEEESRLDPTSNQS